MTLSHGPLWTLEELSAEVASALALDYAGQSNGRVRDVPDIRTIRYYTTLGLMDRPAQMRGRTALYGERHLLQLVAIKRLQTRGLTLAEIQSRLVGQTDTELRRLAQMPDRPSQAESNEQPEANEQPRTAFWTEEATALPEGGAATEEVQLNQTPSVHSLVGVSLAEGVTLLLEAGRSLDELDVEALRSAAAPMLKILRTRRMLEDGKPQGETP